MKAFLKHALNSKHDSTCLTERNDNSTLSVTADVGKGYSLRQN